MPDTVLVTGASGFIAKHCTAELLRAGYRVRATVRAHGREAASRLAVQRALGTDDVDQNNLEFVIADLSRTEGWPEAVAGCRHVLHVASPFPLKDPKNRDDLIRPARDGALRVLRAAREAGVERVVLTSSMAAICYVPGPAPDRLMTEADWTDPDGKSLTAYLASKTIAERAAWDWHAREGGAMGLATINPGLVLGPALDGDLSSSLDVIRLYARGEYPALPRVSYPISDVRDVARMHVLALSHPAAMGERWICANGTLSVADLMRAVGEAVPDLKRKLPTYVCSDFVIRGLALFDRSARSLLPDLGRNNRLDNAKARERLVFEFRDPIIAARDAARSLRELGII